MSSAQPDFLAGHFDRCDPSTDTNNGHQTATRPRTSVSAEGSPTSRGLSLPSARSEATALTAPSSSRAACGTVSRPLKSHRLDPEALLPEDFEFYEPSADTNTQELHPFKQVWGHWRGSQPSDKLQATLGATGNHQSAAAAAAAAPSLQPAPPTVDPHTQQLQEAEMMRQYWAADRRRSGPGWGEFVYLGLSLLGAALLMKWTTTLLDPNKGAKKAAIKRKKQIEKRLGRPIRLEGLEDVIALDVINPAQLDVTLEDIGGLQNVIEALNNKVILPLKQPGLFSSSLLRQPKGVLLYGPPGTGKTMLAKALAKESGASFINIRASAVQSKWFGDSQKLVTAIFTLAWKIQPAIIFIDEVDSMLGKRRDQEHEAITSMKTEFMQLWDGFLTPNAQVLVLAATNRPYDLDEAVLRRFSLQFEVPLPTEPQREAILKLTLRKHAQEVGVETVEPLLLGNAAGPDGLRPLQKIAAATPGFSGSDLFELCCQAAAAPVHEFMEEYAKAERQSAGLAATAGPSANGTLANGESQDLRFQDCEQPRAVTLRDFEAVVKTFFPSNLHADLYQRSQQPPAAALDTQSVLAVLAAMGAANFARENGVAAPNGTNGNSGSHGSGGNGQDGDV